MILLSQGDRVRIVEPENIKACEAYKGFETVVTKIFSLGVYVTDSDGDELFIKNEELKYLEKIEPKKTKNQRIAELERWKYEADQVLQRQSNLIEKLNTRVKDMERLMEPERRHFPMYPCVVKKTFIGSVSPLKDEIMQRAAQKLVEKIDVSIEMKKEARHESNKAF